METLQDWNLKIISMIARISRDHPELIKYLDETSISIPNERSPHINVNTLREFYESLLNLEKSGECMSGNV